MMSPSRSWVLFGLLAACEPAMNDPMPLPEQEGIPRSAAWGEFELTRPERSPREVLDRARAIGAIVLENPDLPDSRFLDDNDIAAWANVALAVPERQSVIRFSLDGRDVLATYRPRGDRITIAAMDTRVRPESPQSPRDPGIGEAQALRVAQACLTKLEVAGVLGQGEFASVPHYRTNTPVHFETESWVERYNFVFNPDFDGLPLRSAEVVISVNAWTSVCQRISVGGQVRVNRVSDAHVVVRDEADAIERARSRISTMESSDIVLTGEFGYYLPFESDLGRVSPSLLVQYAPHASVDDIRKAVGRKRFVGLSLDGRNAITDLLGPTWQ